MGVCFSEIDRHEESMANFQLAHAILVAELGDDHPRAQTAQKNIEKERKEKMKIMQERKRPWVVPVFKMGAKKGKKKKGKGKKKK